MLKAELCSYPAQCYENNGTEIIPASQCGWIIHYISPALAKILGM